MERIKILVVDDESRMRKLVRDFLQKNNYEVLEAGDGSEALDIFFAQSDIALVILDVMMPKMDGWQVCREIRSYSRVPIIMLTARGDEKDELQGFELGVDEYISKPFSPKILVARVEAILRRTAISLKLFPRYLASKSRCVMRSEIRASSRIGSVIFLDTSQITSPQISVAAIPT